MTFVENDEQDKQRKKEQEAIQAIQEKKRKDLEDQIKKRSQDVKNHKPVQNLDIPANQQQQMPMPPVGIINNVLFVIATENYPPIDNVKDIDPKVLEPVNVSLSKVINEVMKSIQNEYKMVEKEFTEDDNKKFVNQIIACIRELVTFNFITTIPNTEEGIMVKMNPKALSYIDAIGYLVPANDFRNQYAVYHSLCNI